MSLNRNESHHRTVTPSDGRVQHRGGPSASTSRSISFSREQLRDGLSISLSSRHSPRCDNNISDSNDDTREPSLGYLAQRVSDPLRGVVSVSPLDYHDTTDTPNYADATDTLNLKSQSSLGQGRLGLCPGGREGDYQGGSVGERFGPSPVGFSDRPQEKNDDKDKSDILQTTPDKCDQGQSHSLLSGYLDYTETVGGAAAGVDVASTRVDAASDRLRAAAGVGVDSERQDNIIEHRDTVGGGKVPPSKTKVPLS